MSRPVTLTSKSSRRTKLSSNLEIGDNLEQGDIGWFHSSPSDSGNGWFEDVSKRSLKGMSETDDNEGKVKKESLQKSSLPPRQQPILRPQKSPRNPSSLTIKPFFVCKSIIQFSTKLLIRITIFIIIDFSKNPRKALVVFVLLFILSLHKTPSRSHKLDVVSQSNIVDVNVTATITPILSSELVETPIEKEDREREELLMRLNSEPYDSTDSSSGSSNIGVMQNPAPDYRIKDDQDQHELLKFFDTVRAQAEKVQSKLSDPSESSDPGLTITNAHKQNQLLNNFFGSVIAQAEKAQSQLINANQENQDKNSTKFHFSNNHNATEEGLVFSSDINETVSEFFNNSFNEMILPSKNATESIHIFPKRLQNLADIAGAYGEGVRRSKDIPYFWYVPLAGGMFLEKMFSKCWDLVQAADVEVHYGDMHDFSLHVIRQYGNKYINLDITSATGILRAKSLNLVSSGKVGVVVSPTFYETADIFTARNRGILFSIFRHPIERSVEMFHHLQTDINDRFYQPEFANMTLEDYASKGYAENNYLTRFLSRKLGGAIRSEDVALAKEIIRKKCVVGLYSEFEKSVFYFEQYFGWNRNNNDIRSQKCIEQLVNKVNNSSQPSIKEGSREWNLLARQNIYDLELYEYITSLFSKIAAFNQTSF